MCCVVKFLALKCEFVFTKVKKTYSFCLYREITFVFTIVWRVITIKWEFKKRSKELMQKFKQRSLRSNREKSNIVITTAICIQRYF